MFRLLIAIIIALAGWSAYQYLLIQRAVKISVDLIAKTKPYEQHPVDATAHIVVAGDSTGVGVGAADSGSVAWRIGQKYPTADIKNSSVSGIRLAQLVENLKKLSGTHYQLVVLQIGANDITGFTSFDSVQSQLNQALTLASQLGDHIVLVTSGNVGNSPVFVWPFSTLLTWRTKQVRAIFMDTAKKYPNTTYVDLFKEKKDDIFNTDISRYYAPDRFHPRGEGYGVWFEEIEKALPTL